MAAEIFDLSAEYGREMGVVEPTAAGDLVLGHVVGAAGLEAEHVMALRHTVRPKDPKSLRDLSPEGVLAYSREHTIKTHIFPKDPPRVWLIFLAEGARGTRSRFHTAYENHGEVASERTEDRRFYHIAPSLVLSSLRNRLLIDWGAGSIRWARRGPGMLAMPVIEISDRKAVAFPGYANVLLSFAELRGVMEDPSYAEWRAALGAVQGIYAISDARTGQLYVGKADGAERLLGRWASYAQDGHGGNVALKALGVKDPTHKHDFVFSILRVFDPGAPTSDVNVAESHYKRALLTREFGLNLN